MEAPPFSLSVSRPLVCNRNLYFSDFERETERRGIEDGAEGCDVAY